MRRSDPIPPLQLITLALALLILPLRWILAWTLAAAFHELCHMAAVGLCGGRICGFRIGLLGTVLDVADLSSGKELLCALAGPLGGLLLLGTAKWLPATAVCAAFQSAYNLLPIYPLDGGRALRSASRLLFPPKTADAVCRTAQWLSLAAVFAGAIYAAVWLNLGWMPLILAFLLFTRTKIGKTPCKPGRQRVQ